MTDSAPRSSLIRPLRSEATLAALQNDQVNQLEGVQRRKRATYL